MFVVVVGVGGPVGLADHQLCDVPEDQRHVVVVPGAHLYVGAAPVLPDQWDVLLVWFVLGSVLPLDKVNLVSRYNELEAQVHPVREAGESSIYYFISSKLTSETRG